MRTKSPAQRWQTIVRDWERSGLSAAHFCRLRSINLHTFYSWRSRLLAASTPPRAAAFVEARVVEEAVQSSVGMVLELGRGVRARVVSGFDPALLREIADALGVPA
jgi:hypothetical protein